MFKCHLFFFSSRLNGKESDSTKTMIFRYFYSMSNKIHSKFRAQFCQTKRISIIFSMLYLIRINRLQRFRIAEIYQFHFIVFSPYFEVCRKLLVSYSNKTIYFLSNHRKIYCNSIWWLWFHRKEKIATKTVINLMTFHMLEKMNREEIIEGECHALVLQVDTEQVSIEMGC